VWEIPRILWKIPHLDRKEEKMDWEWIITAVLAIVGMVLGRLPKES